VAGAVDAYVVTVHGVGTQSSDFSASAQKRLRDAGAERGVSVHSAAAHWAPIADRVEAKFLGDVSRRGSSGRMLQRSVITTAADALMYLSSEPLRAATFDVLDAAVSRVRGVPLTFVAHSLGVLIVADYLRAREGLREVRLVSLGCNLGLFCLGQRFECPPQLRFAGSWVNCFDQDDALGFPLRGVTDGLGHVQDIEVSVGSWWWGWTGAAHVGYWGDRDLFARTLPQVLWG
jgi:hypothetical protein